MSLTIKVADITVRERVVVLPDDCPKCHRPLREAALTLWEFQDQQRQAAVQEDGTVDFDPDDTHVPEGGEEFIGYVNLVCGCGEFLADGKFDVVEESEAVTGPEGSLA
jgi:hypothetical protein